MSQLYPSTSRQRRLHPAAFVALFLLIAVLLFVVLRPKNPLPNNSVHITNLNDCTKGISQAVENEISTEIYTLVGFTNQYNKLDTPPKYSATIRDGTCKEVARGDVAGYTENTQLVKTTDIILDIPDAKQSWSLRFDWVSDRKVEVDLGEIIPSCLPTELLRYGDFKCVNVLSLKRYGTDKYDPILPYMPYSGAGFDLAFDPEVKKVTATIYIPTKEQGNQELVENDKAIIPYWFEKRGLDINKYTIEYNIVYN